MSTGGGNGGAGGSQQQASPYLQNILQASMLGRGTSPLAGLPQRNASGMFGFGAPPSQTAPGPQGPQSPSPFMTNLNNYFNSGSGNVPSAQNSTSQIYAANKTPSVADVQSQQAAAAAAAQAQQDATFQAAHAAPDPFYAGSSASKRGGLLELHKHLKGIRA